MSRRKKSLFKMPTHLAVLLRVYQHKQPHLYERMKGMSKSELTQLIATLLAIHFNIDGAGVPPREALQAQVQPRLNPEPVDNLPRPKAIPDATEPAPAPRQSQPKQLEYRDDQPSVAPTNEQTGSVPMSSAFAESILLQMGQFNG